MLLSAFSINASAADCGSFTIADMTGNSASLICPTVDHAVCLNNGYQGVMRAYRLVIVSQRGGLDDSKRGSPNVRPSLDNGIKRKRGIKAVA